MDGVRPYNIDRLINNLRSRNIDAHYFESIEQAKDKILGMIPDGASIGIGNSQTLINMNISKLLSERGNMVFDKTGAGTEEEASEQKRKALLLFLLCNFYICCCILILRGLP